MEGDVVGLQIGSLDMEIQRVMVTLDVRENTVAKPLKKMWTSLLLNMLQFSSS